MEKRTIRSFVLRQGRMTPSQQKAFDELWSEYGLQVSEPLDQSVIAGRPVILEIGFGMGDSLVEMARNQPDQFFVGVEVHRPGVGRCLRLAKEAGVENLRVFCDDAIKVLELSIADASLQRLQLFFPDPWPKKKHHKRRIVQPEFIQLIRHKLQPGGHFHAATDWQNYAEQMMEVLSGAEGFENPAGAGNYSQQPDYRPRTKFEKRGERLGHGVWDLIFQRVS